MIVVKESFKMGPTSKKKKDTIMYHDDNDEFKHVLKKKNQEIPTLTIYESDKERHNNNNVDNFMSNIFTTNEVQEVLLDVECVELSDDDEDSCTHDFPNSNTTTTTTLHQSNYEDNYYSDQMDTEELISTSVTPSSLNDVSINQNYRNNSIRQVIQSPQSDFDSDSSDSISTIQHSEDTENEFSDDVLNENLPRRNTTTTTASNQLSKYEKSTEIHQIKSQASMSSSSIQQEHGSTNVKKYQMKRHPPQSKIQVQSIDSYCNDELPESHFVPGVIKINKKLTKRRVIPDIMFKIPKAESLKKTTTTKSKRKLAIMHEDDVNSNVIIKSKKKMKVIPIQKPRLPNNYKRKNFNDNDSSEEEEVVVSNLKVNNKKTKKVHNSEPTLRSISKQLSQVLEEKQSLQMKVEHLENEILQEKSKKKSAGVNLRKIYNDHQVKQNEGKLKVPIFKEKYKKPLPAIENPVQLKGYVEVLTEEERLKRTRILKEQKMKILSSSIYSTDYEVNEEYYKEAIEFWHEESFEDFKLDMIANGPIRLNLRNIARPLPLIGLMKPLVVGVSEDCLRSHGQYVFLNKPLVESASMHRVIVTLGLVGAKMRAVFIIHQNTTLTLEGLINHIMNCLSEELAAIYGKRENMLPQFSGEVVALDKTVDPMYFKSKLRCFHNYVDCFECMSIKQSTGLPTLPKFIAEAILKEKDKLIAIAMQDKGVQKMLKIQQEWFGIDNKLELGTPGPKSVQCPNCSEVFNTFNKFDEHRKGCEIKKEHPFRCEICQKDLGNSTKLKTHVAYHTRPRHQCHSCPKSFKSATDLGYHQSAHTGIFLYNCELCQFKCNYPYLLKRHNESHENQRNYVCKICNRGFNNSNSFMAHRARHKPTPLFNCISCQYKTRDERNMKRHNKTCGNPTNQTATQGNRTLKEKVFE